MNVVLVEPKIPPNTGNVGRSCVATATTLHLAGKLGYELSDPLIRRSGLDYWDHLDLKVHQTVEEAFAGLPREKLFFFTTKGTTSFWDARYAQDSYLVFGSEDKGLPDWIHQNYSDRLFYVPINHDHVRSLNLSACVSVVLFEALRQTKGDDVPHPYLA